MTTAPSNFQGAIGRMAPVPRRYFWLKRLAALGLLVVVLLICLRAWWGVQSNQRLQAEINRIRDAGEPILMEIFALPPVADEDNAALLLQEAAQMWNSSRQESESHELFLKDNAEALALVRQTRSRPGCDWGIPLSGRGFFMLIPYLRSQRDLALGLTEAANSYHEIGNDAEAIEVVQDIVVAADLLEQSPSCIIVYLVGTSIRSLAVEAIEQIAADLRITASPHHEESQKPALRDEIDKLIEHLHGENVGGRYLRAMRSERGLFALNTRQLVANGKMSMRALSTAAAVPIQPLERSLVYAIKPLLELDTIRVLRQFTQAMEAGKRRSWPAAERKLPTDSPLPNSIEVLIHPLSSQFIEVPGSSVLKQDFHVCAQMRMAAIALAIRSYAIDHEMRPATLAQLVDEYLPLVPQDPFARDGRMISFVPTSRSSTSADALGLRLDQNEQASRSALAAPPPMLYSVGPDGVAQPTEEDSDDIRFILDVAALNRAASADTGQAHDSDDDIQYGRGEDNEDRDGKQQP